MGLFKRKEKPEARSFTLEQLGLQIAEMGGVTPSKAMRQAAVWACVRVLTGSASTLPMDVVRVDGGVRAPVAPPPLITSPSSLVDVDVWLAQVFRSLFTDGNAFGLIADRDRREYPTKIETVDPGKVTERKVEAGVPSVRIEGKLHRLHPWGDVWHVPGLMVEAGTPFALSPLEHASLSIGAALSAEQFGADFLDNGGHPSSLIYSDEKIDLPEAQRIKRAFVNAATGREPAVLGSGLKYEAVQVDPDDSQFIDLMRFEVENVCRFFGVPPSMVYASVSGQAVTYANVSQADLHYLKHSLDAPLVRVERALSKLLPGAQTVKFNRDALLRADSKARYEAHAIALQHKFRSVNEVRALEDEPPFDGGEFDEPGIPGSPAALAPIGGDDAPTD